MHMLLSCLLRIHLSPHSELPMQDQDEPAHEEIYVAFCSHTDGPGVNMMQ